MAAVTAFCISGLTLWFWSNDHAPPHFHAKRRGEWEVKVYFLRDETEMIEVVWHCRPPSKKMLRDLGAKSREQRGALLEQWQELRDREG